MNKFKGPLSYVWAFLLLISILLCFCQSYAAENFRDGYYLSVKFLDKFGSQGSGDGQFRYPLGIAVGESGKIYVVDAENYRVQIFKELYLKNADQPAPAGLLGVAPTTSANDDGKITGTTLAMEYKLKSDRNYASATETEITGLVPGTYQVRYAAKFGFNAGAVAIVVVNKSAVETVIRVKDKNGNPVSGAVAYCKNSSWQAIGTTNSQGESTVKLIPGDYKFRIVYGEIEKTKTQNIRYGKENIVGFVLNVSVEPLPMTIDFEGNIDGWNISSWDSTGFTAALETGNGIGGSKYLSIYASTPNDIAWEKTLDYLEPGKTYILSGYIKGEGIVNHDNGSVGASLCIMDSWDLTSGDGAALGTFDWKKFELQFTAPATGTLEIGCRLGFWSNLVTGKAFFDNLSISLLDLNVKEGRRIIMTIENDDISVISSDNYNEWVSRLDDACEGYADLVGGEPYSGEKVKVLSTRNYPGGWAVAGNPILWYQPYIKAELERVNANDDWSFGLLHEIGHVFDLADRWNFDAEFWANTKMCFILEALGGKVKPDQIYYKGTEIETYYKTDSKEGYDKKLALNIYSGDSLTYCFMEIKNQIGWEPFKLTFRYFNSLDQADVPQTRLEKFNLFLDKLDEFSNPSFETRSVFTQEQLTAIQNALSN